MTANRGIGEQAIKMLQPDKNHGQIGLLLPYNPDKQFTLPEEKAGLLC